MSSQGEKSDPNADDHSLIKSEIDRFATRLADLERKMEVILGFLIIIGIVSIISGFTAVVLIKNEPLRTLHGIILIGLGIVTLCIGASLQPNGQARDQKEYSHFMDQDINKYSTDQEANNFYILARSHSRNARANDHDAELAKKYLAKAIARDPGIKTLAEQDKKLTRLLRDAPLN